MTVQSLQGWCAELLADICRICVTMGVICSARLVSLEVLDFTLMLLGGGAAFKGAEIAALAGFGIDLTRIEPILSRFEFANHAAPYSVTPFLLPLTWIG